MSNETLQRCIAFERGISRKVVERAVPWQFGTSYETPSLEYIRDLNYLDAFPDDSANAVEIAAEVEQVQGDLSLPHRKLRVLDEAWGKDLAGDLVQMGWKVDRFVVMAYEGPAAPPPGPHPARALDLEEYKTLQRRSVIESSPNMLPKVVDQIVAIGDRLAGFSDTTFIGIHQGDELVSACEIISDGTTAQIESVTTLEGHRRKGLAHSLMAAAIRSAGEAHGFIFLVADDEDWPKDFYTRIGFRAIGKYCDLVIPDITNSGEDRG